MGKGRVVKGRVGKNINAGRATGKVSKPRKRQKPVTEETQARRDAELAEVNERIAADPPPPAKYNPYGTTGGVNPMDAAIRKQKDGAAADVDPEVPLTYLQQNQITIEGGTSATYEVDECEPVRTFAEAPFRKPLKELLAKSYQEPTPIQSVAWPLLMAGHDLVAIAKTGSGKTCGYLLPIINGTRAGFGGEQVAKEGGIQAIVLAPTRELIAQIATEAKKYAAVAGGGMMAGTGPIEVAVCTGGDGVQLAVQLHEFRTPPEGGRRLLCATPGRLAALLEMASRAAGGSGSVVGAVRVLVLDEADRLLEMGFEDQLNTIVDCLPQKATRQTLFFSATWPASVRTVAAKYTKASALRVRLGKEGSGGPAGGLRVNPDVKQMVAVLEGGAAEKTTRLISMMAPWIKAAAAGAAAAAAQPKKKKQKRSPTAPTLPRGLIFTNTKKNAATLSNLLGGKGIRVDCLHGDREQVVRTQVVRAFSEGLLDVLVATDVAARGLDLPGLALVVNFDFPPAVGQAALEQYVHRVGRTGRLGEQGVQAGRAFTFFDPELDHAAAHGLCELLRGAGQAVPSALAALDDGGLAAARGGSKAQKARDAAGREALNKAKKAAGYVEGPW